MLLFAFLLTLVRLLSLHGFSYFFHCKTIQFNGHLWRYHDYPTSITEYESSKAIFCSPLARIVRVDYYF
jgi:hypothetical protein